MTKKVLITDTLFVGTHDENFLREKGFLVERLPKLRASEDELCEALVGVHGYILGGIEQVTERVVEAAASLEVIAFTGSGYSEFIPAHATATRRGIAITAARGGNATAVAEYSMALILGLIRRVPMMTSPGGTDFFIAPGLRESTLGVIGFGHVGRKVAELAHAVGMRVIATARSAANDVPSYVSMVDLDTLLSTADTVTVHVDKVHGRSVLGKAELARIRSNGNVVNTAFPEAVDCEALHAELNAGRLFAAFDAPPHGDFSDVPPGRLVRSNAQTAFNTRECNAAISARVVNSIFNLLTGTHDIDLVNPEFTRFRAL